MGYVGKCVEVWEKCWGRCRVWGKLWESVLGEVWESVLGCGRCVGVWEW